MQEDSLVGVPTRDVDEPSGEVGGIFRDKMALGGNAVDALEESLHAPKVVIEPEREERKGNNGGGCREGL